MIHGVMTTQTATMMHDDHAEQRQDHARHAAGHLVVILGDQSRVDGNERRGEDALAEKVLQEVRDLEGGVVRARRRRVAEVVRENANANEAGDAAEQDSGGDENGEAGSARLRFRGNVRWRERSAVIDERARKPTAEFAPERRGTIPRPCRIMD